METERLRLRLALLALVTAVAGAGSVDAGSSTGTSPTLSRFDGIWSATLTGKVTEGSATRPATIVSCCSKPTRFTVQNGLILDNNSGVLPNDRADPPLPCDFQVRFTNTDGSSATSIGAISCEANDSAHNANPFLNHFHGTFRAARISAPIACALAKTLARSRVRPVWFPVPQPRGRLAVNASVPIFGPGLEWSTGTHYLFLGRVPGGANLGAPFPTPVESVQLANFQATMKIWRLAKAEGRRLYAEWRTSAGSRADLSYAVAKGETPAQFVAFLRSLQRVIWPTGCR
ncbi:MAG: hypothetical protein ACYDA3_05410 [Gaiellaceae bacterium]